MAIAGVVRRVRRARFVGRSMRETTPARQRLPIGSYGGYSNVDQKYLDNRDVAPLPIASQTAPGRGSNGEVVFSLSDGAVIKPELDAGAEQQETAVYPGGFAAEIAGGESRGHVEFFDDTGKRTSRRSIHGDLLMATIGSPDLPIVRLLTGPDHWAVYTPDGGQLLEPTGDTPSIRVW